MPAVCKNLRPFSHFLGESCYLPGSEWTLTIYPTRIFFHHLNEEKKSFSLHCALSGPFSSFTVMQDIPGRRLFVFGTAAEGYFSYFFYIQSEGIVLTVDRCSNEGITFFDQEKPFKLKRKESHLFPAKSVLSPKTFEKIHFGAHKKQDWPLVKRRLNLDEILPVWFALGKSCIDEPLHHEGAALLLRSLKQTIENKERLKVGSELLKLFSIGFKGLFTPRLIDDDYQGVIFADHKGSVSPLVLLSQGAKLIRSLFIEAKEEALSFLPCLPVELHAGRLEQIETHPGLLVDCTWSKKELKTITLRAKNASILRLDLPNHLASFRLRLNKKDKGIRLKKETQLCIKTGETYLLDRFQN